MSFDDRLLATARNRLGRLLGREARLLSAARQYPLDLGGLLDEIGIAVRGHGPTPLGRAHGGLRRAGGNWEILLSTQTSRLRQRFTTAHEVGHYLIETRGSYQPSTTREYWMVEDACQAFAAELLCPRPLVWEIVGTRTRNTEDLLDAIDEVAARTDIALEAAARRIVETSNDPIAVGALTLDRPERPRDGIARLEWLHANRPDLAVDGGRGRFIRSDDPLGPAVRAALAAPGGGRFPVELPIGRAAIERRTDRLALLAAILARAGDDPSKVARAAA